MTDRIEIPHLQTIVARQLHKWESELLADAERRRESPPPPRPWITLSREPGAGGTELGQKLCEALGYDLVDRSILDQMASAGNLDAANLRHLELGPHGAFQEAVFLSLDRAWPGHHAYLKHLTAVATSLAARGGVVFLGRGIHYLLPPEAGLRVRLVAPLQRRMERVMRARSVDQQEATRWIERTDRNQNDLVHAIMRRDLRDVHDYDLVLTTSSLGLEACAHLIVTALRAKYPADAKRVDAGAG